MWKILYDALNAELYGTESVQCPMLTKAKKVLTKRNMLHLWTPYNIKTIMCTVKDEMLHSLKPTDLIR